MTLSASNLAALQADHSARIYFIFLDLANDPFYACTGTKPYSFNAQTWLGIGEINGIGDVAHASDAAARQLVLTLSGVDAYITEPLLNRSNYKGRKAEIYRGLLDENEDLIDDPWIIWDGRMDVGSVTLEQGTAVARMTCEPSAARLLRPNVSRYADEDHKLRHGTDDFFNLLPEMIKKDVLWGGARVIPGTAGGSTPGNRDWGTSPWVWNKN